MIWNRGLVFGVERVRYPENNGQNAETRDKSIFYRFISCTLNKFIENASKIPKVSNRKRLYIGEFNEWRNPSCFVDIVAA